MTKQLGKYGEDIACKYLERKGYVVVTRNWTTHWGELDLIMKDAGCLVFVEVKFRSNQNYGDAIWSLHYYKLRALSRSIETYLFKFPTKSVWRFDVLTITKLESQYRLQHFQDFPLRSRRVYY